MVLGKFTSPGNLIEIYIFGPHPRPTESEALGLGASPPGILRHAKI